MTVLSIFMTIGMLLLGGLAIDVTNAVRAHTQLQTAADMAGHAALYWVERNSPDEARAKAVEVARLNMPPGAFGEVLSTNDIEFGTWDRASRTFTPDPSSRTAVRVQTRRVATNNNALTTFLLKLIGIPRIDLNTPSVWETYQKGCMREGFVAQGLVDLQSNNSYSDGFCVHSNTQVSINQNNFFEEGTIVSVPDQTSLDLPRSGFERNEGLYEALQFGSHHLRVFNQLDDVIDEFRDPTSSRQPSYVTNRNWDDVFEIDPGSTLTADELVPNSVNTISCTAPGSPNRLVVDNDEIVQNVVIVTDCEVVFRNGAAIENAVLVTTNTNADSVNAPNGMRIGANDNCTDGGDAQIVTKGGFNVASGLEAFGAQILAERDIVFAANADGIEGAAFTANGEIHGTSNMDFGFCDGGMGNNIEVDYFRMVQ